MIKAVQLAKSKSAELSIISDGNSVYIDEILNQHQLTSHFSSIYTNPAYFTPQGQLRVERYLKTPSGCMNGCPVNLCKGIIMGELIQKQIYHRRIYIGVR